MPVRLVAPPCRGEPGPAAGAGSAPPAAAASWLSVHVVSDPPYEDGDAQDDDQAPDDDDQVPADDDDQGVPA